MNARTRLARTAVYRFFNAKDRLLYVGIARRPPERWISHRRASWWPEVSRSEIKWYPNRKAARRRELLAIGLERPLYNRADLRVLWWGRELLTQVPDRYQTCLFEVL